MSPQRPNDAYLHQPGCKYPGKAGVLVAEARVWRTVYYRLATEEEIAGRKSTNQIFNECRQSPAMKRVLAVYGRTSA